MIDLDTIFDNIDEYSNNIDDLVKALKQAGIKSFEEFRDAAREAGTPVKKSIQDQVAEKFANCEEEDWEEAKRINTEEAYQNYLDSYPEGEYRSSARDRIEELQKLAESGASDEIWDSVNKGSIPELQNFVDNHPNSTYLAEATRLLRELRREQYLGVDIRALARQIKAIRTDARINNPEKAIYDRIVNYINTGKISVEDLLSAIAEDNNFISGTVANLLWENGIISDFSRAGIDGDFIAHMMSNITPQKW